MTELDPNSFLPHLLADHTVAGCRLLRFKFPPGFQVPEHAHDETAVVVQLAGAYAGTLRCGDYQTRAHDVVVVPPIVRHREEIGPQGSDAILLEVARGDLSAQLGQRLDIFRGPAMTPLLRKLGRELTARDGAAPIALESAVLELLATVARLEPVSRNDARASWLEQVRERLDDDWVEPFDLASLARDAGVSRSHLVRAFRRAYGCSIGDYLRQRRLAQAEKLLRTSEQSLADVALCCGFYDQSHFCRLFRQHAGETPSRWRARHA